MEKINWNNWLVNKEFVLKQKGYTKHNQSYKLEDFAYWKTFYDEDNHNIFQIGLLFYDNRKYNHIPEEDRTIGIQYECMLNSNDKIDLIVYKDITIEEFEQMSFDFYKSMKKYL